MNLFDEGFGSEDEGLGGVDGGLRQTYDDPEVFQDRRFCPCLARRVRRGAHEVSVNQKHRHTEKGFRIGEVEGDLAGRSFWTGRYWSFASEDFCTGGLLGTDGGLCAVRSRVAVRAFLELGFRARR